MVKTSTKISHGSYAWIGLASYVLLYDVWALRSGVETLSSACLRAVSHPKRRIPVIVVWAFLTGHLSGKIPKSIDPLHIVGNLLEIQKNV